MPYSIGLGVYKIIYLIEIYLSLYIPGTQWVYVVIKQLVALCSQTPCKCSVAEPPERTRAVHAASMNQEEGS